MNNNSVSSHSSHSIPQLHDENSSIGVTNFLKDTRVRNMVRQIVYDIDHPDDAPNVQRLGQCSLPLPDLRQLPVFEQIGPSHVDNSRLVFHDANAAHRVARQDALAPRRAPEVVIHSGVRQVPTVQQPGLIARTRTSCLSFFQRCFGRTTR